MVAIAPTPAQCVSLTLLGNPTQMPKESLPRDLEAYSVIATQLARVCARKRQWGILCRPIAGRGQAPKGTHGRRSALPSGDLLGEKIGRDPRFAVHKEWARIRITLHPVTKGAHFKMAEQNLVSRTCDYCEEKEIFPAQIQDGDGQRLAHWITLVRMYKVKDQIYPVQKHACKDSCAANIISLGMLGLPKEITDML